MYMYIWMFLFTAYICIYIYVNICIYTDCLYKIHIQHTHVLILPEDRRGARWEESFSVAKPLFKASPDRFLVLMQDVQNWDCEERNFYVILFTNNGLYMYTTCRCVFLNVTTMDCLYQYVILYRIVLKRCSQSCLESWLHDYPTVRLEFEVESGKGGVG